jgi:hypothetical protein
VGIKEEKEVNGVVDVITRAEFDAAMTALQTQIEDLQTVVAAIPLPLEMPDDVKAAFIKFLEWVKANV